MLNKRLPSQDTSEGYAGDLHYYDTWFVLASQVASGSVWITYLKGTELLNLWVGNYDSRPWTHVKIRSRSIFQLYVIRILSFHFHEID